MKTTDDLRHVPRPHAPRSTLPPPARLGGQRAAVIPPPPAIPGAPFLDDDDLLDEAPTPVMDVRAVAPRSPVAASAAPPPADAFLSEALPHVVSELPARRRDLAMLSRATLICGATLLGVVGILAMFSWSTDAGRRTGAVGRALDDVHRSGPEAAHVGAEPTEVPIEVEPVDGDRDEEVGTAIATADDLAGSIRDVMHRCAVRSGSLLPAETEVRLIVGSDGRLTPQILDPFWNLAARGCVERAVAWVPKDRLPADELVITVAFP